jgi:hypothetical protein
MRGNDDRGLLHFNQPGACALLRFGQDGTHLFARLNEFQFDREMVGNPEDV